ncbi:MAG TPA: L,D-transpeptidase [Gaiellaceae bacterium]|jgi:lipoprotein-anchoring transpeptidase ErfK/SrfK|nr:L,D-transpeptidase [Gaiellaceae bacterium]
MRNAALVLVVVVIAGCGAHKKRTVSGHVLAAKVQHCTDGKLVSLGSMRRAYAAAAPQGAVAFARPGGAVVARFGPKNINDYPTVFGVVGAVVRHDCKPSWYRVQLPRKPNGVTAFVRARGLRVETVPMRIVVDLSQRRLTLYRNAKPVLTATVAVGSPSTPTPTGRYYVNQRLVPADINGPFGPAAIGISAFSTVLTGWVQGGPVAIHGTNEPWSIGRAVSNGCIRLPNATLEKVFRETPAGTPVIIRS